MKILFFLIISVISLCGCKSRQENITAPAEDVFIELTVGKTQIKKDDAFLISMSYFNRSNKPILLYLPQVSLLPDFFSSSGIVLQQVTLFLARIGANKPSNYVHIKPGESYTKSIKMIWLLGQEAKTVEKYAENEGNVIGVIATEDKHYAMVIRAGKSLIEKKYYIDPLQYSGEDSLKDEKGEWVSAKEYFGVDLYDKKIKSNRLEVEFILEHK